MAYRFPDSNGGDIYGLRFHLKASTRGELFDCGSRFGMTNDSPGKQCRHQAITEQINASHIDNNQFSTIDIETILIPGVDAISGSRSAIPMTISFPIVTRPKTE